MTLQKNVFITLKSLFSQCKVVITRFGYVKAWRPAGANNLENFSELEMDIAVRF